MNSSICLLVIGDLGETGRLSLSTLENISPQLICVAANESGKQWIEKSIPRKLKTSLCFHDELLEKFEFKQVVFKEDYSVYRSIDFRLLTLLKWDLLLSSMLRHPETRTVLFTDLDIYWFKDPEVVLSRIWKSESLLFVQDDSSANRPQWCCTGVMYWKNTFDSENAIARLRSMHKSQIDLGNLQDDEDTFNQFIRLSTERMWFSRLNQDEFVVGRNFLSMVFNRKSKTVPYCFHANYLTGLDRKEKSLLAVQKFHVSGKYPFIEMARFLLSPQIRRIRNGIKRRIK